MSDEENQSAPVSNVAPSAEEQKTEHGGFPGAVEVVPVAHLDAEGREVIQPPSPPQVSPNIVRTVGGGPAEEAGLHKDGLELLAGVAEKDAAAEEGITHEPVRPAAGDAVGVPSGVTVTKIDESVVLKAKEEKARADEATAKAEEEKKAKFEQEAKDAEGKGDEKLTEPPNT